MESNEFKEVTMTLLDFSDDCGTVSNGETTIADTEVRSHE